MSRVWESSSASGGGLLALLAIADFANDNGIAWPSLSVLAAKARLSVRQLCTVLDELEKAGELKRERSTGGRNQRSRYAVTVSENSEEITLKKLQRKNNSVICDTETVKSTSHAINHHRTVSSTDQPKKAARLKVSDPRIKEYFSFWATEYQPRFGSKYFFTGKDGANVGRLLKAYDLPRLKDLTVRFFNSKERWIIETGGYTIGVFASQINKLVSTSRVQAAPQQELAP
jgi:DNA-binding MarR family transcriptional regulator